MLKQNDFIELILTLVLFMPIWINFLEIKVLAGEQTAATQQGAFVSVHLRLAVNTEPEFMSVRGWLLWIVMVCVLP